MSTVQEVSYVLRVLDVLFQHVFFDLRDELEVLRLVCLNHQRGEDLLVKVEVIAIEVVQHVSEGCVHRLT